MSEEEELRLLITSVRRTTSAYATHYPLLLMATASLACGERSARSLGSHASMQLAAEVRAETLDGFRQVDGVACGSDESVIVFSSNDGRVAKLDSTGQLEFTLGSPGRGPGEFEGIVAAGSNADGIWVVDPYLRRLTLFRHGALNEPTTSAIPRPRQSDTSSKAWVTPIAMAAGGKLLGRTGPSLASDATPNADGTYARQILVFSLSDDVPVSIGETTQKTFAAIRFPSGGFANVAQPLATDALVVASPSGDRVWIVTRDLDDQGTEESAVETYALNLRGDTLARAQLPYAPIRVSREQRDSVVAQHERVAVALAIPLADVERTLHFPKFWPAVRLAGATTTGGLAVQVRTSSGHELWVLDSLSRNLRRLPSPTALSALCGGDASLWLVREDETSSTVIERQVIVSSR